MVKKLKLEELGRMDAEAYRDAEKLPVVILADNIRSMHNVGAIFRTADAFRMESVALCGYTPVPPHREIHKAALGATETVAWAHWPQVTAALHHYKDLGYRIVGIEQTDSSVILQSYVPRGTEKYVLVLGNEVDGLSEEALPLYDDFLEIPQAGTKHSLNVSVCAGIVMWQFFQHLQK